MNCTLEENGIILADGLDTGFTITRKGDEWFLTQPDGFTSRYGFDHPIDAMTAFHYTFSL